MEVLFLVESMQKPQRYLLLTASLYTKQICKVTQDAMVFTPGKSQIPNMLG